MPAMSSALIAAVNASIISRTLIVWPDVTPVSHVGAGDDFGIYFSEDLGTINFKQLKPPFAIVHTGRWEKSKDFAGLYGRAWECPYMIYYIKDAATTNDTLRQKILALAIYLNDTAHDISGDAINAQVLGVESFDSGKELPLNQQFIAQGLPFRGAAAEVQIVIWEDP